MSLEERLPNEKYHTNLCGGFVMCINEFLDRLKFILTRDLSANFNSGVSKGERFAHCYARLPAGPRCHFVPLLLKQKHGA